VSQGVFMDFRSRLITLIVGIVMIILGGYFIGLVFQAVAKALHSDLGFLEAGVVLLILGLVLLVLMVSSRKK